MKELKQYICESNISYNFINSKNQKIFEQATKYKEEYLKHKDRWYFLNYDEEDDMDPSEFKKENSRLEKLIEKCEKSSVSYYDKIYNKLNDDIEKLVKLYVETNSMSHADEKYLITPPELEKEMYKFFDGSTLKRPTDIKIFRNEIIVKTKVSWEAYTMSAFSKSRYETGQDEEWLGSILMECLLGMVYIHEVMLYNTNDIKQEPVKPVVKQEPVKPVNKLPKMVKDLQVSLQDKKWQNVYDTLKQIVKKYGNKYGELHFTPSGRFWDHTIEGMYLSKNKLFLNIYWTGDSTDGTESVNYIDIFNSGRYIIPKKTFFDGTRTRTTHGDIEVTKNEVIEYINKFINEYDWSKK
jgi:hypothetical protein